MGSSEGAGGLTTPPSPLPLLELFSVESTPMMEPNVPRQENYWDCGVFALAYCDAVLDLPAGAPKEVILRMLGRSGLFDPQADIEARRRHLLGLVRRMCVPRSGRGSGASAVLGAGGDAAGESGSASSGACASQAVAADQAQAQS